MVVVVLLDIVALVHLWNVDGKCDPMQLLMKAASRH